MQRTNIYLEEAQTAVLQAASRSQGISRAELVRRLISRGMDEATQGDLDVDLAAINDSFAVLAEMGVAEEDLTAHRLPSERGPDDRARHLESVGRR
jgi:hypothetical protein